MKLRRSDPYRPQGRRIHPLVKFGWLLLILLILLLGLSWWKGGEQPVERIELPVAEGELGG